MRRLNIVLAGHLLQLRVEGVGVGAGAGAGVGAGVGAGAGAGAGAAIGGRGSLKSASSMWAKTHSMAASADAFLTAMAARFEPFSEKPMLISCARMPG